MNKAEMIALEILSERKNGQKRTAVSFLAMKFFRSLGSLRFAIFALALLHSKAFANVGVSFEDDTTAVTPVLFGGQPCSKEQPLCRRLVRLSIMNPSGSETCTGLLVNSNTVVTAAHCVAAAEQIIAVIYGDSTYSEYLKPNQWKPHEQYRHNDIGVPESGFDIAVLKLPKPVQGLGLPSIRVSADPKEINLNGSFFVFGFGDESDKKGSFSELKKSFLSGTRFFLEAGYNGKQMLMIRHPSVSHCKGDSGSPILQRIDQNSFLMVALTSYGGNCREGSTSANELTANYIDWLRKTIKQLSGQNI